MERDGIRVRPSQIDGDGGFYGTVSVAHSDDERFSRITAKVPGGEPVEITMPRKMALRVAEKLLAGPELQRRNLLLQYRAYHPEDVVCLP